MTYDDIHLRAYLLASHYPTLLTSTTPPLTHTMSYTKKGTPRHLRRSTVIPILLLIYLAVMSYIGRGELAQGHYLYYFSIIALTLAAIVGVHFSLKRREQARQQDDKNPRGGDS